MILFRWTGTYGSKENVSRLYKIKLILTRAIMKGLWLNLKI